MAEILVNVAFHWRADPTRGDRIPEQITRTISIDGAMTTAKVDRESLSIEDLLLVREQMEVAAADSQKRAGTSIVQHPPSPAKPEPVQVTQVPAMPLTAAKPVEVPEEEEMSAF